ncbi:MAG: DUF1298 domain-containing protein, partial [Acidobacteriota bacterium]
SLKRSSVFARFVAASGAALRLALRSSDPKTLLKAPLGVDKRAVWSHPIPLEALKRNDVGLQATVNDLVLTAVTGGLRRYLERRGEAVEGLDLRAVVPVNLRPIEQMADLGNRFGVVFLSLPVGIADPLARLAEIRLRMRSLRRSAEPLASFGLLKLIGWAPYLVQRAAVRLFATKATAVMTNVPGPIRTLYLGGKPLRGIVFWVPQAGRVSLGVSICSYAGQVRVGIATDAGQVPDPSEIVEYFHDELGQLRRREPSPQTPDERKNA